MIAGLRSLLGKTGRMLASSPVVHNVGWLTFDKCFRMCLGILVTALFARHLGPELFGMVSFAQAFVALFGPLTYLGLGGLVVKDLVEHPEQAHEITGTTLAAKIASACLSFLLIIVIGRSVSDGSHLLYAILIVTGFTVMARPLSVCELWFQSRVQSKYAALASLISFSLRALVFLLLIFDKRGVLAFVVAGALAAGLNGLLLGVFCSLKGGALRLWRFSWSKARDLLGKSWLLMLAGWGAIISLKIDQLMLGKMSGQTEVGVYAAAVRISELFYFLPAFIALSAFPGLVRLRSDSPAEYNRRFQALFDVLTWLAIPFALLVTFTAGPIIRLLFGQDFSGAAVILTIHTWACIFVFMGEGLGKWFISENVLILSPICHFSAAAVNILLNLVLIPRFGGLGAAVATVVSCAVDAFAVCLFHPTARRAGFMMAKSLLAPLRILTGRRPL